MRHQATGPPQFLTRLSRPTPQHPRERHPRISLVPHQSL
jgi:hypothetical protein